MNTGESSLKIVHFAKYYPPEFGGIESVTQALAEDHAAFGHKVLVVCFTRNSQVFEEVKGVSIRRISVQAEVASQPLAASYLSACISAARNASVVHLHAPNMLAAIAALMLPRRVRVVIHWHADVENKGSLGGLVRPLETAMVRRADAVVATSQAYANASATLRKFKEAVSVIPIGIADLPPASHVPTSQPYVLFVGRLVAYKGLNFMLEAASLIGDEVEFRIVGEGPLRHELELQSTYLGISHKVRFMGRVQQEELQKLINGAAVFCLPSLNRGEAFGVVLLEAMRARRAIVATDIPGSGVSWVNGCGINVPTEDAVALAEAINYLIANPDKALEIGDRARARFEVEFTRPRMSHSFLSLYESLNDTP